MDEFVDQYFEMDPAEDDIIPNGYMLRVQMRVLVEDDSLRTDADFFHFGNYRKRILKYNRWFRVENLTYDNELIHVIGLHDDGMLFPYSHPITDSWYVKTNSILNDYIDYVNDGRPVSLRELSPDVENRRCCENTQKLVDLQESILRDFKTSEVLAYSPNTIRRALGHQIDTNTLNLQWPPGLDQRRLGVEDLRLIESNFDRDFSNQTVVLLPCGIRISGIDMNNLINRHNAGMQILSSTKD